MQRSASTAPINGVLEWKASFYRSFCFSVTVNWVFFKDIVEYGCFHGAGACYAIAIHLGLRAMGRDHLQR